MSSCPRLCSLTGLWCATAAIRATSLRYCWRATLRSPRSSGSRPLSRPGGSLRSIRRRSWCGVCIAPTPVARNAREEAAVEIAEFCPDHPEYQPTFQARIFAREGATTRRTQEFTSQTAGIRVYMEGFRISPYGERGDDWSRPRSRLCPSRRLPQSAAARTTWTGRVRSRRPPNPAEQQLRRGCAADTSGGL